MADAEPYTRTGHMADADGILVYFGAGGSDVYIDTAGLVRLDRDGQDLFARHYFKAVGLAEDAVPMEVPW